MMGRSIPREGEAHLHPHDENQQLFLASFENMPGRIDIGGDSRVIRLSGELLVAGHPQKDSTERGYTLVVEAIRRVALWTEPIQRVRGLISLVGPAKELQFQSSSALEIESFDMRLYYPLLSDRGPVYRESDAVYPQLELIPGRLSWKPETSHDIKALHARIVIAAAMPSDLPDSVPLSLRFESKPLVFQLVEEREFSEAPRNSLGGCTSIPAGTGSTLRELKIHFKSLVNPVPADLDDIVQELIYGACKVWCSKGGLMLVPMPQSNPHVVAGADLAPYPGGLVTFGAEAGVPSHAGRESDCVNIYLASKLEGDGANNPRLNGGVTHECGTPYVFIILDIQKARHNHYLLAHELGHVFRLCHPGETPAGGTISAGSCCSVMVPDAPNSSRNTEHNLTSIDLVPLGSLVTTLSSSCALVPDAADQHYFHIIRDLPYDDGSEPSALEERFVKKVGQPDKLFGDRWSYSDVWNACLPPLASDSNHRYDDGAPKTSGLPMFEIDYTPKHSEPWYGENNHMYVRLHTGDKLEAQKAVKVHLLLAVPGAPLDPLLLIPPVAPTTNPIMFSSGVGKLPAPGIPTVGHLVWQVPDGYPAACCVFAVARSNNEPNPAIDAIVNNPSAHTFFSLYQLLQSDNDIAQRNLHIQSVTPASDSGLWTSLAWAEMANPFPEPFAAFLEIDTSQAPELGTLILEANDQLVAEMEAGKSARIALSENLQPGQRLILRLRAQIPSHMRKGRSFPIILRFFKGEQCISGYRQELRIATFEKTLSQVADTLFGALRDVGVGFESDNAAKLARSVALRTRRYAGSPEAALDSLSRLSRQFAELAGTLDHVEAPETPAVQRRLYQLAGVLLRRRNSDQIDILIEQIRDLADRIQEPAGRLARRKQARQTPPGLAERVWP